MISNLLSIKGIHPGVILERELKQRKLGKGRFAISLNEFPQTLVSIMKGKRKMNIALALKIEKALNLEEGYLMLLQLFHDIEKVKREQSRQYHPDYDKLRSVLFWDTQLEKIDWEKQKRAVINRVFERGNQSEKEEIIRFYGKTTVEKLLNKREK